MRGKIPLWPGMARSRPLGPPAGCPSLPFLFWLGGKAPTKIDYRQKSGYPYSNLYTGGPSLGSRLGASVGLFWPVFFGLCWLTLAYVSLCLAYCCLIWGPNDFGGVGGLVSFAVPFVADVGLCQPQIQGEGIDLKASQKKQSSKQA